MRSARSADERRFLSMQVESERRLQLYFPILCKRRRSSSRIFKWRAESVDHTVFKNEKIKPDLNKELGQLAQILGSLRKIAKSCIATEQERKAFYKELLQIGLEDIDSLEEQRINEIIQKYISE